MSRIAGVDINSVNGYTKRVLEGQAKIWGDPLLNHLIYARNPTLFKAIRGMWTSLNSNGLLDEALVAMVNRRVAILNGCVF